MSALIKPVQENKRSMPFPVLVKRLFQAGAADKKRYFAVCGIGLTIAALEMIPPRLVGNAVNIMGSPGFAMSSILRLVGIWFAAALVIQILNGFQIRIANANGERALGRLRVKVFTHLQKLSMGFHNRVHVGRILSCMGQDINALYSVLTWGLNTVTANLFFLVLTSIMLISIDVKIFLATFWLAPFVTIVNYIYGSKVDAAWKNVRHHSAVLNVNQTENIDGARVVAAFNRQEENLLKFNELQAVNAENHMRVTRRTGLFNPILQWIRFTGQAIVLLYGGYRVISGDLTAGDLVSASLYWEWFMMPASNLGSFINEMIICSSAAERVFSVLDENPEVKDHEGAQPLPRLNGRVTFDNVGFGYQPGQKVLKQLSFEIPAGSTVAVVGATGSGKSTVLSLLGRFYEPTSGSILIDGYDITKATLQSLRSQVAIVLQSNYLFSGTIIENLRYGSPDASDEEIFAAARTLGAHDRILALKDGYQTQAGDKGGLISLGERQLICFTRALVRNPRILLLDEATSALDPALDQQVQQALRKLIEGRTTIIVTHRLSTAVSADLVLMLERGQLVESGTHFSLIRKGGAYARLYNHSLEHAPARALDH